MMDPRNYDSPFNRPDDELGYDDFLNFESTSSDDYVKESEFLPLTGSYLDLPTDTFISTKPYFMVGENDPDSIRLYNEIENIHDL